jgi:hypothetical protein
MVIAVINWLGCFRPASYMPPRHRNMYCPLGLERAQGSFLPMSQVLSNLPGVAFLRPSRYLGNGLDNGIARCPRCVFCSAFCFDSRIRGYAQTIRCLLDGRTVDIIYLWYVSVYMVQLCGYLFHWLT